LNPTDRYEKIGTKCVKDTAFKSGLLLIYVFKVDILEVLRQLALYTTIGRPETSKRTN
jgi:hypothetical protein